MFIFASVRSYFPYKPIQILFAGFILVAGLAVAFSGCSSKAKRDYIYITPGYYYRLLAFQDDAFLYRPGYVAVVSATFKTQSDSVFWDSHNNLNDHYYIRIDSVQNSNILQKCVSRMHVKDSSCVLINKTLFFSQNFNLSEIPFFSLKDSVVKINLIINEIISLEEFARTTENLRKKEFGQLTAFFGSAEKRNRALDSLGFYWVNRPAVTSELPVRPGDLVNISYKGQYLNGRFLEISPPGFQFIYGTPDQLLKGINYVISRLKMGQNAKIILPSRLAFGEKGSSNGTVPPYTPLLYEIKINDIKPNNNPQKTPGSSRH